MAKRTLLRTAVLVGVNVMAQIVVGVSETDNIIGSGIALFAVIIVVSATWGIADGVRQTIGVAAATWIPTAGLTAVLSALCVSIPEALSYGEPVVKGLTNLALYADLMPFLFGLVAIPAALGVALGHLIRRVNHRPEQVKSAR